MVTTFKIWAVYVNVALSVGMEINNFFIGIKFLTQKMSTFETV